MRFSPKPAASASAASAAIVVGIFVAVHDQKLPVEQDGWEHWPGCLLFLEWDGVKAADISIFQARAPPRIYLHLAGRKPGTHSNSLKQCPRTGFRKPSARLGDTSERFAPFWFRISCFRRRTRQCSSSFVGNPNDPFLANELSSVGQPCLLPRQTSPVQFFGRLCRFY